MSKYHALGKEAWQALPNIFSDNATVESEGLEGGESFWAYTYMFPHATRKTVTCEMVAGVNYSALTGMFTKYVQAQGDS